MPRLLCVPLHIALGLALLFLALSPRQAEAARIPGGTFAGATSDGGIIVLAVAADGATVTDMKITYGVPGPDGCPKAFASESAIAIENEASFAAEGAIPGFVNVRIAGIFDGFEGRSVAGVFSADPAPGVTCPLHRLTWTASRADASSAASSTALAASYRGRTTSLLDAPPQTAGSVELVFATDGRITSLTARVVTDCEFTFRATQPIQLVVGRSFLQLEQATLRFTGARMSVSGVVGPSGFGGGFVILGPTENCRPVAGIWAAQTTTSPGRPVTLSGISGPSPAPRPITNTVTAGGIPSAGYGLLVFGGGTTAGLVATVGCTAPTASFWVTAPDGSFTVYVPAADVGAVNAAWLSRFASGIPANTPILGRCQ